MVDITCVCNCIWKPLCYLDFCSHDLFDKIHMPIAHKLPLFQISCAHLTVSLVIWNFINWCAVKVKAGKGQIEHGQLSYLSVVQDDGFRLELLFSTTRKGKYIWQLKRIARESQNACAFFLYAAIRLQDLHSAKLPRNKGMGTQGMKQRPTCAPWKILYGHSQVFEAWVP